jgi:hypothetical protein
VQFAAHAQPVVNEALQRRGAYLDSKAGSLFELELYLVVLYEGWTFRPTTASRLSAILKSPRAGLRDWLSADAGIAVITEQLDRAVEHLHQKALPFSVQLADTVAPRLLPKGEAFRFFRLLLNYAAAKVDDVALKHDTHLDFYVADSAVECHRDHLMVDDFTVNVMTMKEPPSKTFAHILGRTSMRFPAHSSPASNGSGCRTPRCVATCTVGAGTSSTRRFRLINYVSTETKPEEMLTDDSATATVNELGQSLIAMEVHGTSSAPVPLTIIAFDRDPRRVAQSVAECTKVVCGHDGALYEESYNLLNAWLGVVPGNSTHNPAAAGAVEYQRGRFEFLFTLDTGSRTSQHLEGRECLAVFETNHQTRVFLEPPPRRRRSHT